MTAEEMAQELDTMSPSRHHARRACLAPEQLFELDAVAWYSAPAPIPNEMPSLHKELNKASYSILMMMGKK